MIRKLNQLALGALVALVAASMVSALAAANTVPGSKADDLTFPITPNDLKPNECDVITVTAKLAGGGNITGTGAAELIVGGPAAQTLRGGGGTDCIVGGGGNDDLRGEGGNDVILGGPGADTINGGAGTGDVCYQNGGGGPAPTNCETVFP